MQYSRQDSCSWSNNVSWNAWSNQKSPFPISQFILQCPWTKQNKKLTFTAMQAEEKSIMWGWEFSSFFVLGLQFWSFWAEIRLFCSSAWDVLQALFSEGFTRILGSGQAPMRHRKFCLNIKRKQLFFYWEGDLTLLWVAWGGCGLSIHGNIQNPIGHRTVPTWTVGFGQMISRGLSILQQFANGKF